MPSTAVVAGAVLGVLALAALGIGLGVGLTRDNGDENTSAVAGSGASGASATTNESGANSGTRDFVTEPDTDVEISDAGSLSPSPAPTDPTFAFAPTPSRAFGPGFVPAEAPLTTSPPSAPTMPPTIANTTAPTIVATAPPTTAPAMAPTIASLPTPAPAPAPVPAPAPAPVLAPAPAPPVAAPVVTPVAAPAVIETAAAPTMVEDTSGIAPGPDGKYAVCPGSWGTVPEYPGKECGVTVNPDGTVVLGEYFGGFDGFFDVDPADGHENCFNGAVAEMFQQAFCEQLQTPSGLSCQMPPTGSCVCLSVDKDNIPLEVGIWPGNQGVIKFLTEVRNASGATDFDYPQDEAIADGGGRMNNVNLVTAVFQEKIVIGPNC